VSENEKMTLDEYERLSPEGKGKGVKLGLH
jgi:hypothetical protein